ncbi:MAG: FeoB-associated Cys-rich membrane protein [Lachnospiraceae bacterium]|nr:FeoB-associated Cys-rich membrane protein [Lachnospiraceae bacterium]
MGATLADIIIILILAAALGGACLYIYRERKKGRHCIGCPMAGNCPRHSCNAGPRGKGKES